MNIKKIYKISVIFCLVIILFSPTARVSAEDKPYINVANIPANTFETGGWPTGLIVTAAVHDPSTGTDYVLPGQVTTECRHLACAVFNLPEGVNLFPYWTITVTDGNLISQFTLADVRVSSVDMNANTVTGTVEPYDTAYSLAVMNFVSPNCDNEFADISIDHGNWTANFASCDITYGSWGALNYFSEQGGLIGSWRAPTKTLKGFYQPVDMNNVYNIVKAGSTVPLKFEIFAGSTELTDTAEIQGFSYAETTCDANAITDDIETTTTGGTSLRYDTTAGQFIYNWKTPRNPGKCYRVTMTTIDYLNLVSYFKLK